MSVTQDAFLGGRLHLFQPMKGYRAGVDPVLLAASVTARAGESVLDLGCGTGAVALCLHARVPGLVLTGVERNPDYAALARRNANEAGAQMQVVEACVSQLPEALRQTTFNHVVTNPPYYLRDKASAATDPGRAGALSEDVPLPTWVDTATRRLTPGGWVWIIQRADRLADVLDAMDGRLGSVAVRPFAPRAHRDASLVVIRARKGGGAALRLLPPVVMHDGPSHSDGGDYTPRISRVLREAAALEWDDQIPGVCL